MKTLLYIFIITPLFLFSQVGINTTTPQETLHVEGTLCVSNTSSKTADKLSGTDPNGVLSDINVGANLALTGNTLNAIYPISASPAYYLVATIVLPQGSPGDEFNDLDLLLTSTNLDRVVFRLTNRIYNYEINGIAGGSDGRHVVLFNVTKNNLALNNNNNDSLPQNRIITLANNVATSGQGTAELVYDGTLQRWILIGFRD